MIHCNSLIFIVLVVYEGFEGKKGGKCILKTGEAPKQTIDFEEMAAGSGSLDLDENFYGDQDFDMEDFDKEGFGGLDEGAGASYEEEKY